MYCVYVMSSADNKHVYVGSTKNLKNRSWKHMNDCKHGRHKNYRVQALYNSTGKEFFEFDVLSEHTTQADVLEYEQAWVDYYAAHPTVWNLLNIATENVNCSMNNPEVAAKMSASLKGRPAHNRKSVYVKWADGREITYPSKEDAAKAIGCSRTGALHRWLNGKNTTFYKRGIDEIRYA